ncbi:hypothetical protein GCM10023195_49440 [Actinoallomurus liliacearum]|uniref:DNA-binding domain-containing protein n=1 Tax=Actinoallomurus liliacearum TaxID=1080073 RepID=A0ABP8TPT6_9ACTN
MSHRNARLTVHGRRLLVERVSSGRPVAHVAAEMGISRATAHKWLRRWRTEGQAGLHDRSSRPLRTPHRTPAAVEERVCRLRQGRKLGPARIGPILGLPASTVHRILTRHGLNRLSFLDRPTGQVIRRYTHSSVATARPRPVAPVSSLPVLSTPAPARAVLGRKGSSEWERAAPPPGGGGTARFVRGYFFRRERRTYCMMPPWR